jgi:acetyl esterase
MPLDPQAQALLEQMREAGQPPFEHMTVQEARQAAWAFVDLQAPPQPVAAVSHRFIPGPTADLPVRIYTPEGDGPFPAIVYLPTSSTSTRAGSPTAATAPAATSPLPCA